MRDAWRWVRVGHVAIREIVRLEEEERVLQKAQAAKALKEATASESSKKAARSAIEEELGVQEAKQEEELDNMQFTKEAIIRGPLLGRYPALAATICANINTCEVR